MCIRDSSGATKAILEGEEEQMITQLTMGIEKSQHSDRTRYTKQPHQELKEITPPGLRRRGKHRAKITTH